MPVEVEEVTVANFEEALNEFSKEEQRFKVNLILFLADNDPSTNRSWCPDCVRAEPVIYKALESSTDNIRLLKTYVGDRNSWRNVGHPLRNDSRFKLSGVPTLIRWELGTVKGRLEDHEAHLERKINEIIS